MIISKRDFKHFLNENCRMAAARQQKYRYVWQLEPHRQQWLRRVDGNEGRARCLVCPGSEFDAHLHSIIRHEQGQNHIQNLGPNPDPGDPTLLARFEEKVALFTILLVIFFARYKLPFTLIVPLLALIKFLATDWEALNCVKMSRTKLGLIMKNAIAAVHKRDLSEELMTKKFSISFDESTDISAEKHGCVLVRFFNSILNKIKTYLWDLVTIYEDDDENNEVDSEVLYQRVTNTFGGFGVDGIPPNNLVGIVTDGCNAMIGPYNSFVQKFRRDFLGIKSIVCPSHQMHKVAEYAYQRIPVVYQTFDRDIYNFFKSSSKRLHALFQSQIELDVDNHKLLRPVPTRWLVMGPVIRRILEQYDAIEATLLGMQNPPANALQLIARIQDPFTKAYLFFLNDIVSLFESFNGAMQREDTMLPRVYELVRTFLDLLLRRFMRAEYVDNFDPRINNLNLDVLDQNNIVGIFDINIGEDALLHVQNLPEDERFIFYSTCLEYYQEAAQQFSTRLERFWRGFECLNFLLPSNALSPAYHQQNPDIMQLLALEYLRCTVGENDVDVDTLQHDWEQLIILNQLFDIFDLAFWQDVDPQDFWIHVRDYVHQDGSFPFQRLGRFAVNILTIIHSNAEVERKWSEERLIKTYCRNCLGVTMLKSIMLVNDMLKYHGCFDNILNFVPSQDLLNIVRFKNYYDGNAEEAENQMDDLLAGEEDI